MKKAKVNTDDKTSKNDTTAAADDSQDGSTHACDREGTSQGGVTGIEKICHIQLQLCTGKNSSFPSAMLRNFQSMALNISIS